MSSTTVIAETQTVCALAQDFGGDGVVVTFNAIGTIRQGLQFWGAEFLAKERLSSVGIVTTQPNWYPRDEMQQIVPAVRRHIGERKTVTYGFSQGGYGALKFSRVLQSRAAIAFNPQWSINPADVSAFDRNYTQYFDCTLMNGASVLPDDVGGIGFCIYDPHERVDLIHAQRLMRIKKIRGVIAPFTWHGSIVLMTEAHVGGELLRYCLDYPAPNEGGIRRLLRRARWHSHTYMQITRTRLLERLVRSRQFHSTLFLDRANARCELHRGIVGALAACSQGNNSRRRDELDHRIMQGELDELEDTDLVSGLEVCKRNGLLESEARLASRLCTKWPGFTYGCLCALATLTRAGYHAFAKEQLMRLVVQNRDAARYFQRILALSLALRYPMPLEHAANNAANSQERAIARRNLTLLLRYLHAHTTN